MPAPGYRLDLLEAAFALPGGEVVRRLAGPAVHLVGGTVRDLLLGRRPKEIDLVVELPLSELLAGLPAKSVRYERFETATVYLDGAQIDLARSRRERYPRGGALPEVEPAPLAEDLRRRDFTVNALALTTGGPDRGLLHAVPHGLEDLEGRLLRVLHPASFEEDPTRLFRLARYRARLGFEVEAGTAAWAQEAVRAGALETVSCRRRTQELVRCLRDEEPIAQIERLADLGLLAAERLAEPDRRPLEAALQLLAETVGEGFRVERLCALALLADAPLLGERPQFWERSGLEREELKVLKAAPRLSEVEEALRSPLPPAALYQRLRQLAPEAIAWAAVRAGEEGRQRAAAYLRRLRAAQLAISGKDLLAAGAKPGPKVGAALEEVRALLLEGEVGPDRAEQLQAALAAIEGRGGR